MYKVSSKTIRPLVIKSNRIVENNLTVLHLEIIKSIF